VPDLTPSDWRFCLQWTLATAIAIGLCGALGPIGLLVGPVVLAIAQGYVLRRKQPLFLFWGIATLVSGYVAIALVFVQVLFAYVIPLPVVVAMGGAIVGVAQAIVLRSRSRYWAWWPLVSAVVLTLSLFWFMPDAVNVGIYGTQRPFWVWMALAALTGLIGGILKGLTLIWLLKHPQPRQSGAEREPSQFPES
jgi:hypothetical protein